MPGFKYVMTTQSSSSQITKPLNSYTVFILSHSTACSSVYSVLQYLVEDVCMYVASYVLRY